jgi:CRP/FNR family cyclic AMP-dependent transcriptional regulator
MSSFFDYERNPAEGAASDEGSQYFLRSMDADDWTRFLSVAEHRLVSPREVVIHEGERSRAFFVVAAGSLEIFRTVDGREQLLHRIEPMSIFGEQAFFDGLPRSATVRAITDAELFAIGPDAFEVLGARHPHIARLALLDLGHILSVRLRTMTDMALTQR